MSDLAPFVAAALRDKVVQDLQEEIAKLRKELEEKTEESLETLARDAVHGYNGVYRIAIVGPRPTVPEGEGETSPIVYAVENIFPLRLGGHDGGPFQKINDCTLGDLLGAEICVNGVSSGLFSGLDIKFTLSLVDLNEFSAGFSTVEEALNSSSWLADGNKTWASFTIEGFSDNVGVIWFDLVGVSMRRFLEFVSIDLDDFLANPRPLLDIDLHDLPVERLASFFGEKTLVHFEMSDDIS